MNQNDNFNQPMGQNFNNPGYVQPQQMPKNNNKNTIIYVAIFVVAFVIGFIAIKGFGPKVPVGEWDCGSATIKFESNKNVTINMYGTEMKGKLQKASNKLNSSSKKDGFKYTAYTVKDITSNGKKITSKENLGFYFGVSKDGKEGHYVDGGIGAVKFDCKKK